MLKKLMRTTKSTFKRGLAGVLLAAILLALPAYAAAAPAGDEYLPQVTDAGGKKADSSKPPVTNTDALPPEVARQLGDSAQDKALAQAATASELGAPEAQATGPNTGKAGTGDDDDPGAISAAVDSVTGSPALLLILGLVAIAGAFGFARSRRT